jgi:hypothetical protein
MDASAHDRLELPKPEVETQEACRRKRVAAALRDAILSARISTNWQNAAGPQCQYLLFNY